MTKVLVIGGAGFLGSATTAYLLDQGYEPWVLDDLSTGRRECVLSTRFSHFQIGNQLELRKLLTEQEFDCVMHFAGRRPMGEGPEVRDECFENNVMQMERLLETLVQMGRLRIVFSSSCAVYGDPGAPAIDESCAKKPLDPYGESILAAERLLERFAREHGLQAIALRCFNAAGADPKLRVGEWHDPEEHLLPRVMRGCLQRTPIEIYGTDYPTDDGTCVRDFIHVWDVARAHEAAMTRLLKMPSGKGRFEAYNLGSENGFSVREVVEGCFLVSGVRTSVVEKPRRAGDPAARVADCQLARKVLGFQVHHSLEDVMRDTFAWEKKKQSLSRKAIFLDRDGTLNEDPGYLSDPELLKLFPDVSESLARLKRAGFVLVVTSNQSGVARGLIAPGILPKIHNRLNSLLRPAGGAIDHFELCLHHPDENCECRKPKPKLIRDAAQELGIDVQQSYMIGDKLSDMGAGRAAGCKASVLVRTGEGEKAFNQLKPGDTDFAGATLTEAVEWILNQESEGH
jgi:UDP-glucose-4-epimerase GalE